MWQLSVVVEAVEADQLGHLHEVRGYKYITVGLHTLTEENVFNDSRLFYDLETVEVVA